MKYMNSTDVCEYFGIIDDTLARYEREGLVPFHTIEVDGKPVQRYLKSELDDCKIFTVADCARLVGITTRQVVEWRDYAIPDDKHTGRQWRRFSMNQIKTYKTKIEEWQNLTKVLPAYFRTGKRI